MIVGLLSDVVVFIGPQPLHEISKCEDSLCLERIILKICLLICVEVLSATTLVTSRFFLVTFKLFKDLQKSVDGFALVVFVIDQTPFDKKFEEAL